jgi:DNA-binding GntR family transcriptional regulator
MNFVSQPKEQAASLPLAIEIVRVLSREIAAGQLAPGTKLDEEGLRARFQTSRTPIREALKHLSAQRLVELKPRQGAFVMRLTTEELAQMFETMGFLESACASLAARRHTEADREALAAAHASCQEAADAVDPERFYAANNVFHECIYTASHNDHLKKQTLALRLQLEPYRRESTFHAGFMALSLREHDAVMQAILSMDEDAAATRMRHHLDTLRNDAVSVAAITSRGRGAEL